MKSVVIIHHEPLTKKIARNFFIDELISKGLNVYYFDIHRILFGRIKLVDEITPDYNFSIQSLEQAKELIRQYRDAFFIVEFELTVRSFKILHYLKKYNCRGSTLGIHSSINLSLKEKLLNIHNYGGNKVIPFLKRLVGIFTIAILKPFYPIKKNDIAFYCGMSSLKMFADTPIKIPINSFDFEDFRLKQSVANEFAGKRYVVFLDENLPFHPDVSIWNKQNLDPEKYFQCLNNLFDKIEKSLSLEVIVALHPKSEYKDGVFLNRSTYKYRTAELVKNCEFVIAHDSLSMSFAVLNNKPLLFAYMSDFYRMGTTTMVLIKKFSLLLGCTMLKIDEDFSMDTMPKYSHTGYLDYKYNYLTSKTCEEKSNSDILYDIIISDIYV